MKKLRLLITLCCILMLNISLVAHADEVPGAATETVVSDTNQDIVQEPDAVQETTPETTQETTPETTQTTVPSPPEAVDILILTIDLDNPDEETVKSAREAYEGLSMAEKVRVEYYSILEQAEEMLEIPEETTENTNPEDGEQKSGTSYTFRMSSYRENLTISMRYVTDKNGDGVMEAPEFSLTSPTGNTYNGEESIINDECSIEIVTTKNFTQLNISQAIEGTWTLDTTNRVVFVLSEYAGSNTASEFETITEDQGGSQTPNNTQQPQGPNFIPLILLIIGGGAAIIIILRMPFGKKDDNANKKSKNKPKKHNDEEEDTVRPLTQDEEIARIKAEWARERASGMYDNFDVKTEEPETQNYMAVTVEDQTDEDEEWDDSAIEEFDEDFPEGSRFN